MADETPGLEVKKEEAPVDPRQGLPDTVKVEAPAEGEKGFQPFTPDASRRPEDPRGQYIKYTGQGTVRVMGPDEWKAAGVDSDDYFEWNYLNKKKIARSAFSDDQLQYLLRIDDRFELVDAEAPAEAKADK